jgi:hypothetical protein
MATRATLKKKGNLPKGFKGMQIAIQAARKTWKSKKSSGEPAKKTRRRRHH